jgi:hypothetical protein
MCTLQGRLAFLILVILCTLGLTTNASAFVKGIYLTQTTLENTDYLNYLIKESKKVGINTFVVDMEIPSKKYQQNIALLKNNDIQYVARVVVFPDGGKPEQIASPAYWAKRYNLIKTAVSYGAQQIQLDYIRYNTKQPASTDNSKHIITVVQWFKDRLEPQHIPLQADVFGISSFGESKHIGQNLRMMAQSVDALCPMVYPSHFEPFRVHAVTPYQTIYTSLKALRSQFNDKMPVKLYAYIEISNYRYPLSPSRRHAYVLAEMKAVKDADADGYFVWSAHNKYDYLFGVLAELQKQSPDQLTKTMKTAVDDSTRIPTKKETVEAISNPHENDSTVADENSLSGNNFTPWTQMQASIKKSPGFPTC